MRRSLKIVVIMGGPSAEHAISLNSGQGVVDALRRRGWDVSPLRLPSDVTVAHACEQAADGLRAHRPDVVFLALHGPFGEDGTIQQVCETFGVPYTGSDARASRLGLDKVASRQRFEESGVHVPAWELCEMPTSEARVAALTARLPFPVVVKPTNQGSSFGVSIATSRGQLIAAMREAARYDRRVLVEAYIEGREVTVGILGERALPIVEIQPGQSADGRRFFDYAAKYTPGQTTYVVPAPLDEQTTQRVQQAGLMAHRVLGCRHFSRADLILRPSGEPVVLELNTIPGLTATSLLPKAAACVGISYDQLCEQVVCLALTLEPPTSSVAESHEPAIAGG